MDAGTVADSGVAGAFAVEIAKLAGVAFLSFVAGRYLERFKFRQVELTARVDDVCELIGELCDLGDDYWREKGDSAKAHQLAGKINGLHFGLNGAASRLGPWRTDDREQSINNAFFLFSDVLTGGDFGVKSRSADPDRTPNIWRHGAALKIALRQGRSERYTFWGS